MWLGFILNLTRTNSLVEGCAHAQQLIWQLFNAVEKGYTASGDNDEGFLSCKRFFYPVLSSPFMSLAS